MTQDKRVRKQVRKLHKETAKLSLLLNESEEELNEVTLKYASTKLTEIGAFIAHLTGAQFVRHNREENNATL